MTNTTWSPADCSRSVTISGGNLTALSGATGDRGARCGDTQSTGKFYFECTFPVLTGVDTGAGFCDDGCDFPGAGATSSHAITCYKSGNIWSNGVNTTKTLGALAVTDVLCCALDIGNAKVWFRKNGGNWNGVVSDNPATNTGGIAISIAAPVSIDSNTIYVLPFYAFCVLGANADKCTANFGDTAFAQTVPAGFTSGWPQNPITSPSGLSRNECSTVNISDPQQLTVTAASVGALNAFCGASPHYTRSTGKYHVQYTVDFLAGATYGVGLSTQGGHYASPGSDNNSIIYIGSTGVVKRNGATVTTLSTYATGDVIDMEFDLDNDAIWFRKNGGNWNGSALANPATNTGGISISALLKPVLPWFAESTRVNGDACTLGLGYLLFSNPVSAGFTAGWPVAGPQVAPVPTGGGNVFVNV